MSTAQSLHGSCLQLAVLHACDFPENVPLLHRFTHVTARDEFYQAFPRVSTANDKCLGKKPV